MALLSSSGVPFGLLMMNRLAIAKHVDGRRLLAQCRVHAEVVREHAPLSRQCAGARPILGVLVGVVEYFSGDDSKAAVAVVDYPVAGTSFELDAATVDRDTKRHRHAPRQYR